MRRIVFLDCDGVLNSEQWVRARSPEEYGKHIGLDPVAVARLNRLIANSGADVVVSSSWRIFCDPDEMQRQLDAEGFVGEVVGETVHYLGVNQQRGDEIREWLDRHPEVEAFVVLDDSCDMHTVEEHHVRTSPEVGLTDDDVTEALRVLGVDRTWEPESAMAQSAA